MLPVFATIIRSFEVMAEQWRLLTLPFVALSVFNLLIDHLMTRMRDDGGASIGLNFLTIVIGMSFITGIHRTVLLNEARNGIGFFRFDRSWLRHVTAWATLSGCCLLLTLSYAIVAAASYFLIAFVLSTLAARIAVGIETGIAIIVMLGMLVRLTLSLPAAAIGEPRRLALSWRATRGNVWRMIGLSVGLALLLVCVAIPSGLTVLFVTAAIAASHALSSHSPLMLLPAEIWLSAGDAFATMLFSIALSLTYDRLARGGA
jgi:hypothetical protein